MTLKIKKAFCLLAIATLAGCSNAATKVEYSCINAPLKKLNNCQLSRLIDLQTNPPEDILLENNGENIRITSEQIQYQESAFIKSAIGLEVESLKEFDYSESKFSNKTYFPENIASFKNIKKYEAITKIIELAQHHQIVMLNEAHHVSYHRVFALELARALKNLGYSHIAVEAISDADSLNESGYPTTLTGYYISDPEFGFFLREAHKLGYRFIGYESNKENREQGQADNLKNFIKNNPNAKIFIYAGYSHIRERSPQNKTRWMAERLKIDTGIDPLTIDQVGGTPRFHSSLQDPIYKLAQSLNSDTSVVIEDQNKNWVVSSRYQNTVDLTVFHSISTIKDDQTKWFSTSSKRLPYDVEINKSTVNYPFTINAFNSDEWHNHGIEAIPIESKFIAKATEPIRLQLPRGSYQITLESKSESQPLYTIQIK